MSVLMRASEILRRPVVTLAGEDIAEIKDVVYAGPQGDVAGFTLNGRGLFAGPLKQALPWSGVHGLGAAAVMVASADVFEERDEVLRQAREGAGGGNVLGSTVLTDTGVNLGQVSEVIIEVGETADVVGYEIDSTESLGRDRRRVLIPLPDTISVSVESLIVPAAAVDFVCDDLAGFGAAVDAFRARLHAGTDQGDAS
ncbi:MAG: PRC-barrel domain-containing protein [Propionibacteriaceae bacterium]